MASCGIAACLLDEDKAVHSTLAIPLEVNETITCKFAPRSNIAPVLNITHLMIWVEAPMASRFAIEPSDRTMQNTLGDNEPFGGRVLLF